LADERMDEDVNNTENSSDEASAEIPHSKLYVMNFISKVELISAL